ncbi:hypothetical protein COLO4_32072 [Corchorus olitorius]|uniref:Uncharacterized protein n=1 Tax=Corchorus olitorius TaxID=93759 RepID=A0A1R3H249_9ROSI|nr:hypothetical protein COLO4_32072 [Corchorus olitorius]
MEWLILRFQGERLPREGVAPEKMGYDSIQNELVAGKKSSHTKIIGAFPLCNCL